MAQVMGPGDAVICPSLTFAATAEVVALLGATPVFADIPVNFATANPRSPVGLEIGPGDQHLKVNWTAGDTGENIATYDVHVLAADAGFDPSKYADDYREKVMALIEAKADAQPAAFVNPRLGQQVGDGVFRGAIESSDQIIGYDLIIIELRRRSDRGKWFHGIASCDPHI